MSLNELKNKKIAILGLGIEGIATVRYLRKHGILVAICDERLNEESEIVQEYKNAGGALHLGKNAFENISEYDVLFRSPGISINHPKLQAIKEKEVILTSHTKLFFDLCPCPIIGVTGTKGKGTTATLIYEMLKKQGVHAFLGGNIGQPPLDFLDSLSPESRVVLELSSFQLIDMTMSPHIAVMLMITSEHLDYHADLGEYIHAKQNILRFQKKNDFAVINRDYIASHESDIHTEAPVFQISIERPCENGCYVKEGSVYFSRAGKAEKIIATKDILLLGKHNLENVCAAVMAATLTGVATEHIGVVLKTFKGLPHRLQPIREVNGVTYYDDSFSTTPETAIAAIESFTQPEILILGGSSKNSDFSALGKTIRLAKNIKAIIGIGIEWERIKEQIGTPQNKNMIVIEGARNMHDIVIAASKIGKKDDAVLLSPACASFDMFKNYKERGEQFKVEVEKL